MPKECKMNKRYLGMMVVLTISVLTGCVSLGNKSDDIGSYKEIPLSDLSVAVNTSGLYVVKMNPTNKIKFTYDQYHYDRISIDSVNYSIGTLISDSKYEQLFQRLQYTENASFYIYVESTLFSYDCKITRIDGLISISDMKNIIAEREEAKAKEKAAKEDEKRAAEVAQKAVIDEKAKILASGYVYHGVDEDGKNSQLFNGGALETGHAYYISNFLIGSGGATGGILSIFSEPTYHIVDYLNQKVKGEVAVASKTISGAFGLSVVIAGGEKPLYIPVILGVVE